MTEPLRFVYGDKTVQDLLGLWADRSLNLDPGFQRKSVWSLSDRRKLIHSILQGFPVPSVFLYRRDEEGWPVYDVIDGKQRLESILMFVGAPRFGRMRFDVQHQFSPDEEIEWCSWSTLHKQHRAASLLGYRIQTVEVSGELSDIVDLFVRINSTGKALTGSEKRHARYYTSTLLREAERIARRFQRFFLSQQILRDRQLTRMKDVELVSELLVSVIAEGPVNKKTAIDRVVGNQPPNAHTLRRASGEVQSTLRAIRRMFPNLRETRFRNTAEFYSLALLIWDLQRKKHILSDRKRNQVAESLLKRFSNGVDGVLERSRKLLGAPRGAQRLVDYLNAVRHATDNLVQRTTRAKILEEVLAGIFEKKDSKRTFSREQRRLLFNSEERASCRWCQVGLDWTNFQVDHVKPHSRGGRTQLANAALVCRSCNSSKGSRRRPRRRAAPKRRRSTTVRGRRTAGRRR